MNRWMKTWSFSLELILEACSRTMAAIHQPSFEYADKILSEWRKQKITSLDALEQQTKAVRAPGKPPRRHRRAGRRPYAEGLPRTGSTISGKGTMTSRSCKNSSSTSSKGAVYASYQYTI